MKTLASICGLAAVLLAGSAGTVRAWPPAPGFIVHGTVRDPWGWVIEGQDARIRFKGADGRLIAEGALTGRASVTGNYQVVLPLDHQRAGLPYRGTAAGVGLPFRVEVILDGRTWFPQPGGGATVTVTAAGDMARLDFVLGEDSDADGLPDLWEQWQLEAAGLPIWNLDILTVTGDADGDGTSDRMEFAAGTWALLAFDRLELQFAAALVDDWNALRFTGVFDKTYILERSEDLGTWERAPFALWTPQGELRTEWRATDNVNLTVQTPAEGARRWFYRLSVR